MMLSIESLQERLEEILAKTAGAEAFKGQMAWFEDDPGGARRAADDERSGRHDGGMRGTTHAGACKP